MAGSPPVQLATKLVSVIELRVKPDGVVGGGIKVVIEVDADEVGFVAFTAVTIKAYVVDAVRPVKVADLLERPASTEGVVAFPLSVYV